MTEGQLYAKGGIEKGKLRLSQTPLGCGQVLTGMAPRGKKTSRGGKQRVPRASGHNYSTPYKRKELQCNSQANTTDAKKTKAGKKPIRPSKQGIYRPTTTEESDQLE